MKLQFTEFAKKFNASGDEFVWCVLCLQMVDPAMNEHAKRKALICDGKTIRIKSSGTIIIRNHR